MAAPPPPPPLMAGGPAVTPALAPGWQQYTDQQGRPYWANATTGQSTYTPPFASNAPPPPPPGFSTAIYAAPPPAPAAYPVQPAVPAPAEQPKKKAKAKNKLPIEGTAWVRVTTNDGNVFYSNTETKASSWMIPEEIADQVAALGAREREERRRAAAAAKAPSPSPEPEPEPIVEEEEEEEDEEEVQEELTPEAAAELAAIRAEMDAQRGISTKKRPVEGDEGEEGKKKKRKKSKVVHSLAEVDEEFQKEIAAELAAEAEREENGEPPVEAPKASTSELTSEENKALFKSMLAEKDINPMAPWEDELPKFVNDSRYSSVRKLAEKRDLFDEFCKDKAREMRAKKSGAKQDPQQAFRAMLVAEVTSTRAHWEDFRRAHKKDPRFRNFGRDDRDREKAFRNWLRDLGEMKRADAKRHEDFFLELLSEHPNITTESRWSDVKRGLSSDPRYDNVGSSNQREGLFNKYITDLARKAENPGGDAAAKEAKRQQSLRERQEQVQRERETVERAAGRSRQEAGREQGERELRSLYIDSIRDHEMSWEKALPQLQRDPRFEAGNLAPHEKRQLFDDHLEELRSKRVDALEALFKQHTRALNTPFADIYPQIVGDAAVARMHVSPEQVENLFETWQRRRRTIGRNEFDALLAESQFLDFWGRTRKEAIDRTAEEAAKKALAGDDDDAEADDQVDLRAMARTIDLKEIQSTLRNDQRFRQFDYDPSSRESWIRDYLEQLAAPSLTVHQK